MPHADNPSVPEMSPATNKDRSSGLWVLCVRKEAGDCWAMALISDKNENVRGSDRWTCVGLIFLRLRFSDEPRFCIIQRVSSID